MPTIVNLMPSGKYLMEEFFYAGGLPVVIKRLGEAGMLHKDALTVSGETVWDQVKDVGNWNEDVILPAERALTQSGGIAVLQRQPRAARRGAEALRRLARSDGRTGAARSCSRTSTTTRPRSTTRRSTSTRPA